MLDRLPKIASYRVAFGALTLCLLTIPAQAWEDRRCADGRKPLSAVFEGTEPETVRVQQGDAALRQGDMTAAAKGYLTAVLASPRDPMLRMAAGVALAELGRGADALNQFRKAVEFAEDDVIANLLLQNALKERGNGAEAQQVLQDIYRRFGRSGRPNLDVSVSIARLNAVVNRYPESPLFHLLLGDACQISEQWGKADAAYLRSIALAPTWAKPRINLGLSRLAQGKTTEAIAGFENALSRDPKNDQVRLLKGDAEVQAGKNQQAIRTLTPITLDKARRRGETFGEKSVVAQAYANIGRAQANSLNFDEAIVTLNYAKKLAPKDPTPPALLGDVQRQNGDYAAAADSYEIALGLVQSGGLFARRPILYRSLAEAQLSARKPEQARETLEQALRDEPGNAALWHRLQAQAYQTQGNTEKAREELKAALDAETGPYPLDTLRAADAQGAIKSLQLTYQSDIGAAETGIQGGFAANGAVSLQSVPKAERTPERGIRALTALAHLARYGNEPREEISYRTKLIQARAAAKLPANGWDWFLLAETYDQRVNEPVNARAAYLKSLEIGGLSDGATQFARTRLKKLTEPAFKPG